MRELLYVPVLATLGLMAYGLWRCRLSSVWLFVTACVSASSFLSLFYFIGDMFTGEGLTSAVVFHVLHGLEDGNRIGMGEFPELVLLVLATAATILAWAWFVYRRCRRNSAQRSGSLGEGVLVLVLAVLAVPLHPAVHEGIRLWHELAPRDLDVLTQELRGAGADTPVARPKSLVYIYAESYERAFLDQAAFPDLAPRLAELERSSLSFHGLGQAPMTDWTIAGMVASQCGMPLATISPRMNDPGMGRKHFLPGAHCMGDVLAGRGYRLVYVGGADIAFQGKQNFYRTHGFQEIIGRQEGLKLLASEPPQSKWGLYDREVFSVALARFRELKSAGQPFALFVLTTATHPPNGFPGAACREMGAYGDGSNPMLTAAHCSDAEIAALVEAIESEGIPDTLVVIGSDHLQRASGASDVFDRRGLPRENMLLVRGADRTGTVRREATTLDIAPTLLNLLGGQVDGIALGRDLLANDKTLPEKYGRKEFYNMVQHWRANLWKSWGEAAERQQTADTR